MLVAATERAVRVREAEGAQHGDLALLPRQREHGKKAPWIGDGEQLEKHAVREALHAQVILVECSVDPVTEVVLAPQDLPQPFGEGVDLGGVHGTESGVAGQASDRGGHSSSH